MIGEADEFVGVADVNPLWIGTGRIEGDSVRLAEAFGENLHLFGLAIFGHAAKNADAAGIAFGEENIAVRSGAHQARIVKAGGEEFDFETCGRDRPGVGGTRNDVGSVIR